MKKPMTLEQFKMLAKTHTRLLVTEEIAADYLTPISIFEALQEEMKGGVLLESGAKDTGTGRYSFLSFDMIAQLIIKDNQVFEKSGQHTEKKNIDPLMALRQFTKKYRCENDEDAKGIAGGVVGYMAYHAVQIFEKIQNHSKQPAEIPELLLNSYRKNLTFDHDQQKVVIAIHVEVSKNFEKDYEKAILDINTVIKRIRDFNFLGIAITGGDAAFAEPEVMVSDPIFIEQIKKAKEYIVKGDAFQVVLSRVFKMPYQVTPFSIYRGLRSISPAPFMFYLDLQDFIVVGASPEKMASLENRKVTVNPIAGTRPRQENRDPEIIQELLSNQKEVAEHMMLVDLARNDLGSVCTPGSIQVEELMQPRIYSHVIHLTSTVSGELKEDGDAFDVLKATFPAGTVSGAPKIRAMEIINEIEKTPRGLYGGAICVIDHAGNLNSCIAIRMAILKDNVARIQTGAGIVYDSDPEGEAAETRYKAQSVISAIQFAERNFI